MPLKSQHVARGLQMRNDGQCVEQNQIICGDNESDVCKLSRYLNDGMVLYSGLGVNVTPVYYYS